MTRVFVRTLIALTLGVPAVAQANWKGSLCVYDPSGANGDVFNFMKDYRAKALEWGVDFELKPYTDEKIAAEDFKAGKCGAVLMTGVRVRAFHKFASSIEAMGALPSYDNLKRVIRGSSKVAKLMVAGDYEVGAIFPAGAVYLLVRDRTLDTVGELAGKRIATLDFDQAATTMVRKLGAAMVAADISNFAGMFNNGSVDAAYAPATAYTALELHKGVGKKGGVIRYPLAQLTLQLLFRSKDLPEGFGAKSRAFAVQYFDTALQTVKKAEKGIPASQWIELPAADVARYDEMLLDVRVRLRDKEKIYDKRMLKAMRKARCKADATRAECVEKRE